MSLKIPEFKDTCAHRDGKPWFPVAASVGAQNAAERAELLCKMRACGINAVFANEDEAKDEGFLRDVEHCGIDTVLTAHEGEYFLELAEKEENFVFAPRKVNLPYVAEVRYGENAPVLSVIKAGSGANGIIYSGFSAKTPLDETFLRLRRVNMFLAEFGELICGTTAYFSADNPASRDDETRLRYAVRHNGKWGVVFFSNFTGRPGRPRFTHKSIKVPKIRDKHLPPIEVEVDGFGFYPFDMPINGGFLRYMETSPLCFVGGVAVIYGECFDASGEYIVIEPEESLKADKIRVKLDVPDEFLPEKAKSGEYLIISSGIIVPKHGGFEIAPVAGKDLIGEVCLKVFPKFASAPDGFHYKGHDGAFYKYIGERRELIFN